MSIAVPDGNAGGMQRSANLPCYGSYTFSAWLKVTTQNIGGHAITLVWISNTAISGSMILVYDAQCEGRASNFSGNTLLVSGFGSQLGNGWIHVATTLLAVSPDTVTVVALYLNGTLVATGNSPTVPSFTNAGTGTYTCGIGPGSYGTSGNAVDYVSIWNTVLTQAQITSLAAQADPRSIQGANLLSFVALESLTSNPDLAPAASGVNWTAVGSGFTLSAAPFVLQPYPPVVIPPPSGPLFPPPWELGPGPADPALSASFGSYSGSGYGKVGHGTINVMPPAPGT